MIVFTCACGATRERPDEFGGKMARCGKCGAIFRIPEAAPRLCESREWKHLDTLLADHVKADRPVTPPRPKPPTATTPPARPPAAEPAEPLAGRSAMPDVGTSYELAPVPTPRRPPKPAVPSEELETARPSVRPGRGDDGEDEADRKRRSAPSRDRPSTARTILAAVSCGLIAASALIIVRWVKTTAEQRANPPMLESEDDIAYAVRIAPADQQVIELSPPIDRRTLMKTAPVRPKAPPPPAPAAVAEPEALSVEQIVARAEPSIALIAGDSSTGTGFVALPGVVATNAHVVETEPVDRLTVRFPAEADRGGPFSVQQVVYYDRPRDLAFLRVACAQKPLELAPRAEKFRRGQQVTLIGNPGLGGAIVLENAVTQGILSSRASLAGQPYFQLSVSINPGNSGGPVLDPSGRVIGVATLKAALAEGVGFCIPTEDLRLAVEAVRRQRPDEAELASQRHRDAARMQAAEDLRDQLSQSSPGRVLASWEANRLLPEDDPEVHRLNLVIEGFIRAYPFADGALVIRVGTSLTRSLQAAGVEADVAEVLDALARSVATVPPGDLTFDDLRGVGTAYLDARVSWGLSPDRAVARVRQLIEQSAAP